MLSMLLLIVLTTPIYAQLPDDQRSQSASDGVPSGQISIALADESDDPDSGNWYEKLKWWKEAKWKYTVDVHAAMENLEAIEHSWKDRQQEIIQKVDAYADSLPVKREVAEKEIDELIEDMVRRQNEIAKEEGQEVQSDELEEQKKMLAQLQQKFAQFNELVKRMHDAFDQVVPKQLADAKLYDKKALTAYQDIDKTLDDKKAEELYHQVENSLENMQAIANYLKGPLNAFVARAWGKAQEIMPQIEQRIRDLESKGVVVRPLTPEEKEEMAAIEKQRQAIKAKRRAEAEAAKRKAARPWYLKMFDGIGSFFVALWSYISWPFVWVANKVSGSPKPALAKTVETAT